LPIKCYFCYSCKFSAEMVWLYLVFS
jgi:hypothetical protein